MVILMSMSMDYDPCCIHWRSQICRCFFSLELDQSSEDAEKNVSSTALNYNFDEKSCEGPYRKNRLEYVGSLHTGKCQVGLSGSGGFYVIANPEYIELVPQ